MGQLINSSAGSANKAALLNHGNIDGTVRPNGFAEIPTGILEDLADFVLSSD